MDCAQLARRKIMSIRMKSRLTSFRLKNGASWLSALLIWWLSSADVNAAEDKSGVSPSKLKLPKGPGSLDGIGENAEPNVNMGLVILSGIRGRTRPVTAGKYDNDRTVDVIYADGIETHFALNKVEIPPTRPNLLETVDNGIGKRIRFTYGSSTAHMMRDAVANPWQERLSHPVLTLDRLDTYDTRSRVRHYDGEPYEGLPLGTLTHGLISRKSRKVSADSDRTIDIERMAYDSHGNVLAILEPNGNERLFDYDENDLFPVVEEIRNAPILSPPSYRMSGE
jgi:hypothetical protein